MLTWFAGRLFGAAAVRLANDKKTLNEVVLGVAMCLVGWRLARLHLWVFDRLYLRQGEMKRLRQ